MTRCLAMPPSLQLAAAHAENLRCACQHAARFQHPATVAAQRVPLTHSAQAATRSNLGRAAISGPKSLGQRLLVPVWDSGSACMALAALVLAVSALCVKLTDKRLPIEEITLIRGVLAFSGTAVLARKQQPMFGSAANRKWLLVRGVLGGCARHALSDTPAHKIMGRR